MTESGGAAVAARELRIRAEEAVGYLGRLERYGSYEDIQDSVLTDVSYPLDALIVALRSEVSASRSDASIWCSGR